MCKTHSCLVNIIKIDVNKKVYVSSLSGYKNVHKKDEWIFTLNMKKCDNIGWTCCPQKESNKYVTNVDNMLLN